MATKKRTPFTTTQREALRGIVKQEVRAALRKAFEKKSDAIGFLSEADGPEMDEYWGEPLDE
jgi:hypothetical protein